MADSIDNRQDIIYSRDVIERIEELQDERDALDSEVEEARTERDEEAGREEPDGEKIAELSEIIGEREQSLLQWDKENGEELRLLKSLQEDAEGYSGWRHGAALIRDSYFEDHARELASDLHGRKIDNAEWPFNHIDWAAAADELKQDYTSIDFDGVDYWVRS